MGGLFIAVVMFFPNGLAGITDTVRKKIGPVWTRLRAGESLMAQLAASLGKGQKS
jgi:hypothetical protein